MKRGVAAWSLIAAGAVLLVLSLGLVSQAYVGQWYHELQAPRLAEEPLAESIGAVGPVLSATPTPAAAEAQAPPPAADPPARSDASGDADLSAATDPAPTTASPPPVSLALEPTPAPAPSPTPLPDYGEPVGMAVPRIGLDARVTSVALDPRTRQYGIDWWDVGWHDDSPLLGLPGNTVFNGHVDTINAGRVFYRLRELRPGDLVYVYSEHYRTTWVVESTERVPNTEHRFILPTDDVRATFYTCEGWFDWSTQRYADFRVVVAHFVEATERG